MKKFSNDGTYISSLTIGRLVFKKYIQMGIGGFFTVVFLCGLLIGLIENNEIIRDGLITNLIMLGLFILLFIKGIKNSKKISLARRYDAIFMCDVNGTVTINEIARQIGKPTHKVLSELEKLFEMGAFRDCMLQKGGIPCVILAGRKDSRTSFVNVVCEKCNGITRLRAGTSGKCEYCGNAIACYDETKKR